MLPVMYHYEYDHYWFKFHFTRIIIDEAHQFPKPTTQSFKTMERINSDYFWMLTGTPFSGIGGHMTMAPLISAAFGNFMFGRKNTESFYMPRFVQLAVIMMNSSDQEVKQVTSERASTTNIERIDDSKYPYFQNQYKALLDCVPKTGIFGGGSLNINDHVFLKNLRKCCSSYLNIRDILAKAREKDFNVKDGDSKVKSEQFVTLVGDGKTENELVKRDDPCCICMEGLEESFQLSCRHILCHDCVGLLLVRDVNKSLKCPLCRQVCKESQIKEVKWSCNNNDEKMKIDGEDVKPTISNSSSQEYNEMEHPKMIRLFELLGRLKPSASNKIIIFSDMRSSQAAVSKMLSINEEYKSMFLMLSPTMNVSKREAVFNKFATDSQYCMLILPVTIGSVGIDLSVASAAIFIEPFVDTSKQLQSAERMYHVLKSKTIQLYYLVLTNTVEEIILSIGQSTSNTSKNDRSVTEHILSRLHRSRQTLSV